MSMYISGSAEVSDQAVAPSSPKVWHFAQVREGAVMGENVIVGSVFYVGSGVQVGDNCKIQYYAMVYEPAVLADGVFIGPVEVLTNDHHSREVNLDGTHKSGTEWGHGGVDVSEGASIGARAVSVSPVVIGAWSLVASGASLIKGVPARQLSWVDRNENKLVQDAHDSVLFHCLTAGKTHRHLQGVLEKQAPLYRRPSQSLVKKNERQLIA